MINHDIAAPRARPDRLSISHRYCTIRNVLKIVNNDAGNSRQKAVNVAISKFSRICV
jgi:hypothetical protein